MQSHSPPSKSISQHLRDCLEHRSRTLEAGEHHDHAKDRDHQRDSRSLQRSSVCSKAMEDASEPQAEGHHGSTPCAWQVCSRNDAEGPRKRAWKPTEKQNRTLKTSLRRPLKLTAFPQQWLSLQQHSLTLFRILEHTLAVGVVHLVLHHKGW